MPRVIPSNFSACIDIKSLKVPKLFHYIQEKSKINDEELLKTFNCGIGMIVIINKKELSNVHKI